MIGPFYITACNILKNIGCSDYNGTEIWKMVGSSTDFLFGENREAILSLVESDAFDHGNNNQRNDNCIKFIK